MVLDVLQGTKKLIFDTSVQLFAQKSYDSVSIKAIADACGLSKSSVYSHFVSKQELLDTIYAYFSENYTAGRLTIEDIEPIIKNGSIVDIINSCSYAFPEEIKDQMLLILLIVHQRMHYDDRAAELARTVMCQDGITYMESVCNRAIEMQIVAPFDVHILAVLCSQCRLSMLRDLMLDKSSENAERLLNDEQKMIHYAATLITDLRVT